MRRSFLWIAVLGASVLAVLVVAVGLDRASTSDSGLLDAAGVKATLNATSGAERTSTPNTSGQSSPIQEPFSSMVFVPEDQFGLMRELGVDVIHRRFDPSDSPVEWLALLNKAQAHGLWVIPWLWPEGWSWDGTSWSIDEQARLFVQTVAKHPATLAVYALHEPYWRDCWGCGYTTEQQQLLYAEIKAIADVPLYSEIGSAAFWTAQGEETAFAEGVCDYCGLWYYPFREGSYERDTLLQRLKDDVALVRERAPNSKIVWGMQAFAADSLGRDMPSAEQLYDQAAVVYGAGVDGAGWYPWTFGDLYDDVLSDHPELYDTVREVVDTVVLPRRQTLE